MKGGFEQEGQLTLDITVDEGKGLVMMRSGLGKAHQYVVIFSRTYVS